MSGITYYKRSEDIYPGDVTKGCGLTGVEIDANFHFLRGYDILSGVLKEDGTIVLRRLNEDEVTITGLSEYISDYISGSTFDEVNLDGTYYDTKEGILHLIVNGKEFESGITGFFTLADIHTDCTISGDGTDESPFRIAEDIIEGISDLEDGLAEEKEERQDAVSSLNQKINNETTRAKSIEGGIIESVNDEVNRAMDAESSLGSAIESEAEERRSAIEELKEEIKEKDAVITEDVTISENSPLYPFISNIWENNVIPSGTTFTEFVKKLCADDTRMIYYVHTQLSDIDEVIANFDSLKCLPTGSGVTYIEGSSNDHIIGIALPKPHTLTKVSSTQFGNQVITDKFSKNPPRDVVSEGVVYTLYYYKWNVGLGSNDSYIIEFT